MKYYEFSIYDTVRDDWGFMDPHNDLQEALLNPDFYEVKLEYICDEDGAIDCAFVQNGKLPERMADGKKIPKKYHALINALLR